MESSLKQRLLGAAVLIALAVIFVPMFLSGPPPKQTSDTINLDIPSAPERKFETRTLPLAVPNITAPAPAVTAPTGASLPPSPTTSAPITAQVPVPTDSNRLATVDTQAPPHNDDSAETISASPTPVMPTTAIPANASPTVAATVPVSAAAGTAENGRFTLNLGIYADQAHAAALVQNIKKLDLPVFTAATDYQGKPAQRVRVGPFADRAAAEAARLKIKVFDTKLAINISETADTPATTDMPASTLPATRVGGWVVQLGAFKSEGEANKLRERCRVGGFVAFVDRSGAGDQALWRVRAGPEADRAVADKLRASLKQKLQLDGILVTQP